MYNLFKDLIIIDFLMIVGIVLFRMSLRPAGRSFVGPKVIALVLLTPAAGLLLGNVFLFDFYLAAVIAFTSRTRSEVFSTYLLILPLVPIIGVETSINGVFLFSIDTLFAMNVGGFLGILINSKQKRLSQTSFIYSALFFVTLETFIDLRLNYLNLSLISRAIFVNVATLALPYVISSRSISTQVNLDRAMIRFLFSGTLCAIVSIAQSTRHWVLYEEMYGALHLPFPLGTAALNIRGGMLRTGGTMINYTAGGLLIACTLVILPAMKSQFRTVWWLGIGATLFAGLFLTQARGDWAALAAGWLVVLMYRGYIARGIILAVGSTFVQMLLIPGLAAVSTSLGETLGANGHSSETTQYRSDLLREGLQQIAAHPWIGQAPDQLRANLADLTQGQHIVDFVNYHLYLAMASGLIGFTTWVALWGVPIAMPWFNRPKRRTRSTIDPAEMPMAIIVTVMAALTFTFSVDRSLTWAAIALGLMGPCLSLRRLPLKSPSRARLSLIEAESAVAVGRE